MRNNPIIVQKYGGACLETPAKIRAVARSCRFGGPSIGVRSTGRDARRRCHRVCDVESLNISTHAEAHRMGA
jgi:hypothetical protein